MGNLAAILIPWLPALAAGVIGFIALREPLQRFAGQICAGAIGVSFIFAMLVWSRLGDPETIRLYDWIAFGSEAGSGGGFGSGINIGFSYYLDALTMVMLAVITGVGCLIAIYATGYMKGDPGYWRFFTYVGLFIFAMTTLVMADNLVLLFLGWEGVGVCSYLLIGYYYDKPTAVAAAKKAFIVNRIGDFGFLLGIFLIYQAFGTVEISTSLEAARGLLTHATPDTLSDAGAAAMLQASQHPASLLWIPFLLMIGAFGKSAQLPLYVWLPDAMAGPTPVSALVHAATMVTAGVYLIARCIPLFELSPYALPTVAVVGGVTALFAATIAMTCNDLKGVFAYSTVSQLGYMFVGVGCLSTTGAIFHLSTHAFFKALLFLTAGSVMHALAGQLDIRTMGGLRKKMPVTCWLMFAGCLSLAGFPFVTSGFWSKDLILGDALAYGMGGGGRPVYLLVVLLGVVTAFLTAFYSFRLWFTVFMGPERFEMGDDHHAEDHTPEAPPETPLEASPEVVLQDASQASHDSDHGDADDHAHSGGGHAPHEMPWWPMNAPLSVTASGVYTSVKMIVDPTGMIPPNSGCWRAIEIIAPEGSVVNAAFPAPVVYANHEMSHRIADMLFGALFPAMPDRVMACSQGTSAILTLGGVDHRTGQRYVSYETIKGGFGARPGKDGINCVASGISNTMNTPIEVLEMSFPVRVEYYEIATDSGGAGKYRGGCGARRAWRILGNPSHASVCCERTKSPPFGLAGGKAGAPMTIALELPDGTRRALLSKGGFIAPAGGRVLFETPGSGGYGPPSERDPEALATDIRDGYVSAEGAKRDYGLQQIPSEATMNLRKNN